jgi:SpoVK/Ycf46/Vps4 family AAA+-type ATPase
MAKIYPKKVNSYNQFILTLDNKNKLTTCDEIPDKLCTSLLQITEHIKNINATYDNMCNFYKTDLTPKNDPNIFDNKKYIMPYTDNSNVTPENWFPIIKKITIQQKIDTLDDLLYLIKDNPLEPDIQYNINMKVLHNIKEPLEELNNMIGLKELKTQILEQILYFIQELHINKNFERDYMHTVIYGPPGTGKTEVAKIIGKIYCKIGILTKGIFKKVTRNDLIAGYLGQTAIKTADVIQSCIGGVLFIDEVYSLGDIEGRDIYAKECIDILCEALSNHKNNLMVIIAGYEEDIKNCFFSYNQGLDSRFNWQFKITNYTGNDLHKIFLKKINDIGWSVEDKVTPEWFNKNFNYFEYFGRDVEILLSKTKIAHSKRVFCLSNDKKKIITIDDLNEGLKIYLKNDNVINRINQKHFKKELQATIYS